MVRGKGRAETPAGDRGLMWLERVRAALAGQTSLQAAADAAGVERSGLSRFASGKGSLSAESFARLAEALGFRLTGGARR